MLLRLSLYKKGGNKLHRVVRHKDLDEVTSYLWEEANKKFARKDKKNIFTEENMFKEDVIIEANKMYVGELYEPIVNSGGSKKIGRRD